MEFKQINRHMGKTVTVHFKVGGEARGMLIYFSFDKQVVHLQDYVITEKGEVLEQGELLVINSDAWDALEVK